MENSARWLTDKFICLMLLALPLWPGLEGYSDITGAKFRLFAALTLVWLAALGVCAVKYRWRPARPGVFAAWALAFMAAVCLSTLCSGRIGYCLLGSARRDGAVTLLLYGAIALSLFVPWIFSGIEQSIASLFGVEGMFASDWGILTNGRGLFAVYPMFFLLALGMWYALRQSKKAERGPCALPYLSGIQYVQDGKVGFNGPLNTFVEPKSSNYYMEAWFGEQTLTGRINTIAIVLMVVMLGGLL